MQLGIIGIVFALILAGGALLFSSSSDTAEEKVMMKEVVIEKRVMKQDEVMVKDEDADEIEKNMMDKDGSMKTDEAMMKKDEVMMKDEAMTEKDAMMGHGGTYETYSPEKIARASSGKVILFFRASWCPTCRAVNSDIKNKLSSIPKDVTILDVNYDTEATLKSKHGVTYQHTFVQVDAAGAQIAKWSASPTLAALVSEIK